MPPLSIYHSNTLIAVRDMAKSKHFYCQTNRYKKKSNTSIRSLSIHGGREWFASMTLINTLSKSAKT